MAADGKSEQELREALMANRTVGHNPRFPNQNQTKHCWASYVEVQKCKAEGNEDTAACKEFQAAAKSICPQHWIDRWDEQIEQQRFAGQDMWDKKYERHTGHH